MQYAWYVSASRDEMQDRDSNLTNGWHTHKGSDNRPPLLRSVPNRSELHSARGFTFRALLPLGVEDV